MKGNAAQALITIIDCVSATGKYLNPGIVFKGKNLQTQWFKREFANIAPEWHFTVSPNGWTSNEIAVFWLEQVLIPQINEIRNGDISRAAVLTLDGHGSHTTVSIVDLACNFDMLTVSQPEFMRLCFENNIFLIFFPAHCFHTECSLLTTAFSTN